MSARRRAGYAVQDDGEDGPYVCWSPVRRDSRVNERDESMCVYLPTGPRIRARAARAIADALNAAGIPRARRAGKRP